MHRNFVKASAICLAGTMFFAVNTLNANAVSLTGEQPIAGISVSFDKFYKTASTTNLIKATKSVGITDMLGNDILEKSFAESGLLEEEQPAEEVVVEKTEQVEEKEEEQPAKEEEEKKSEYDNIGIAVVDNYLNIREKPSEDSKAIGNLPKNAGCTIYSIDENGWAKIKSGKVSGYVASEFLVTGDEAEKLAEKVGMQTATVNTTTLKVREEASTESTVLTLIPIEEELEVLEELDDWVKVVVDEDEGFVSKEFVDLSYELKKAVFNKELEVDSSSGVTSIRAEMVSFAKKFVGNRYVWGGTSLTNGADCSGFVMSIYKNFGYSISRTSRAQAGNGTTINVSSVKPGDLVFYSNGGGINHVAMSIGNGQVVHASNARSGIKISNMYYRTPVKAVRIIND